MILDAPHEAKWSIGTCVVRVKDISCGMKRLEKNRSKFGSRIAEAAARGGFQVAPCAPPNMPFGARIRPNTGETVVSRSEEHTSELQSRLHLVCRLLLEKK